MRIDAMDGGLRWGALTWSCLSGVHLSSDFQLQIPEAQSQAWSFRTLALSLPLGTCRSLDLLVGEVEFTFCVELGGTVRSDQSLAHCCNRSPFGSCGGSSGLSSTERNGILFDSQFPEDGGTMTESLFLRRAMSPQTTTSVSRMSSKREPLPSRLTDTFTLLSTKRRNFLAFFGVQLIGIL